MLEAIRQHLAMPEYLHVLLNPLPVYGVAVGGYCGAVGVADGGVCASAVAPMINAPLAPSARRDRNIAEAMLSSTIGQHPMARNERRPSRLAPAIRSANNIQ